MAKAQEVIKQEIEEFKNVNRGEYEDYYIGITNDLNRRINESQIIDEHISNGIYTEGQPIYTAECQSRDIAVAIEIYFQEKGMEKLNKAAKGVNSSKYIYCFKMTEKNRMKLLLEQMMSFSEETKRRIMTFKEFIEKTRE